MQMTRLKQFALSSAVALLTFSMTAPVPGQTELPEIGDSSQTVLSSAEEQELGEAFIRELRANVEFVEDPEVEAYIQGLGYRLASHSGQQNLKFTFFVVNHPAVNAFAAPGGFVGVNSGLLTTTQSESELAAVLGHEIAHVTQRHIARSFELADRASLSVLAGLVAAIVIGTQNPTAGVAAAVAVQGGATQALIDFTRANEKEADSVGIKILADAGLDPRAVPTFFQRLHDASKYYSKPPEFLSTHPVTTNRIAEATGRAEDYPYRQYADSVTYHLVRAKLRVLEAKSPQEAVDEFRNNLDSGKYLHLLGSSYGYALALLGNGELDEARKVTRLLIEKEPERISFYELLARIEIQSGNSEAALFIYEDNLELYPQDRILVRGYTDTLNKVNRSRDVLTTLDRFDNYQPLDAALFRIAAHAHERLGNQRSAHASLAEAYYLTGRLRRAIHQLELALRAPSSGNFYADAGLQARLEQLREEDALRTPN